MTVIIAAAYCIIYEPHGLHEYAMLKKTIDIAKKELTMLQQRNNQLKSQLQAIETSELTFEKIAREELQLGYANEYVYLLKS